MLPDWKEGSEYRSFGIYHFSAISFGYSLLAVQDCFGNAYELTYGQFDSLLYFYYSDGEF